MAENTDNGDYSPGEIRRGFERLEKQLFDLTVKMEAAIQPISELRWRLNTQKEDLRVFGVRLRATEAKVTKMELRNAAISGGVVAIGFLVKYMVFGK